MKHTQEEINNIYRERDKMIARFPNCITMFSRKEMLHFLPKGSVGLELGTARGDFAESMLEIVRPKELHLVDSWSTDLIDYNHKENMDICFSRFKNNKTVRIHKTSSEKALLLFPDQYFDWIYIDCDHHYEAVLRDYTMWYYKLKDCGIMMGHDYYYVHNTTEKDGVIKAVNEVLNNGLYIMVYFCKEPFSSVGLKKNV